MPKQYYELTDDKSTKFWEVEQKSSAVHLRWGKIGVNGQSKIPLCQDTCPLSNLSI
jgi:predicted DNA-binding WGR domain protein